MIQLSAPAVEFTDVDKVRLRQVVLRSPGAGDLVLRTLVSGVSMGTELWCLRGKYRGIGNLYPFVPGYQRVAEVVWAGSDAGSYKVGQRVFAATASFEDPDLRSKPYGAHAGYSTVSADDALLLPVPEQLDSNSAALSALAAVSMNGLQMTGAGPRDRVLVVGLGLIGQMSAQLFRTRGCLVYGSDVDRTRSAIAGAHSVDVVVEGDRLAETAASLPAGGFDVVVDATGRSELFASLVELIRPYGSICLQAWYPDPLVIDHHATHIKRPTVTFPCDWVEHEAVLRLMAEGYVNMAPLTTERVSYEDAPKFYGSLLSGPSPSLGVVIDWSSQPLLDLGGIHADLS